jgi:hypothetical protein
MQSNEKSKITRKQREGCKMTFRRYAHLAVVVEGLSREDNPHARRGQAPQSRRPARRRTAVLHRRRQKRLQQQCSSSPPNNKKKEKKKKKQAHPKAKESPKVLTSRQPLLL